MKGDDHINAIIHYKCKNCGGRLEFNSKSQMLKCPFCESMFDVGEFDQNEKEFSSSIENLSIKTSDSVWSEEDNKNFSIYNCNSCGAEIIADETTAATHCPYCDNPVIFSGKLSGEIKPDLIIPFKLDKKTAKSSLIKHLSNKKLLPKIFRSENHIEEIKGVYVPYWLYDATAIVDAQYSMKKIKKWSDPNYRYTETMNYAARRKGKINFENVPVDGLINLDDTLMESIETFDFSEAKPFKTAYLAGYFANRYNVNSDEGLKRACERIRESAAPVLDKTVTGYDIVNKTSSDVLFEKIKVKYALLPVWILNTTWRKNKYIFAMNGQTGKFVGNLPIDNWIYWKYRLVYTGIIGAAFLGAAALFSYFL